MNQTQIDLDFICDPSQNIISIDIPADDKDKKVQSKKIKGKKLESVILCINVSQNIQHEIGYFSFIKFINFNIGQKQVFSFDSTTYLIYLRELLGHNFADFYSNYFQPTNGNNIFSGLWQ